MTKEESSKTMERSGADSARALLQRYRKQGIGARLYEASYKNGSHVYVVLDRMKNPDLPRNGIDGLDIRVGYIKTTGKDVTDEIMGEDNKTVSALKKFFRRIL